MDFANAQTAAKVLATVNGSLIPNTHKVFKLNWASGGGLNDRRYGFWTLFVHFILLPSSISVYSHFLYFREDRAPEYSLFVGDLSNEVSELVLLVSETNSKPGELVLCIAN